MMERGLVALRTLQIKFGRLRAPGSAEVAER